jgi:hypothetical protein
MIHRPLVQWRPGDVFIQIYNVGSSARSRYLETGLYNYLTNERLPFSVGNSTGEFVRLPVPD